jgi:hypothetical protein
MFQNQMVRHIGDDVSVINTGDNLYLATALLTLSYRAAFGSIVKPVSRVDPKSVNKPCRPVARSVPDHLWVFYARHAFSICAVARNHHEI